MENRPGDEIPPRQLPDFVFGDTYSQPAVPRFEPSHGRFPQAAIPVATVPIGERVVEHTDRLWAVPFGSVPAVSAELQPAAWRGRLMDLRIEDHPDPVPELRRIVTMQLAYNLLDEEGDEAKAGRSEAERYEMASGDSCRAIS